MRNTEMSLPQIVDLAANQRGRAERALSVLRRQLDAQESKLSRMRKLSRTMREQLSASSRTRVPKDQLEAHEKAAQNELRTARKVLDRLRLREQNLVDELEEKKQVEKSLTAIYQEQRGRRPITQAG